MFKLQSENDLIPPTSLLEFPLLAHYCNDILIGINEIRRTAPLLAFSALTNTINQSFQRISNAISKYYKYKTLNELSIFFTLTANSLS